MPASSAKAIKEKTDRCRDRKRTASLMKWVAKRLVKQYLKDAAQRHLRKFHNTCATLRRDKAELAKTVKSQKKDLFLLRRDKFVAEAYDRAKKKNDKLDNVVEEAARLRRQLRKAKAEGKAEGLAAAQDTTDAASVCDELGLNADDTKDARVSVFCGGNLPDDLAENGFLVADSERAILQATEYSVEVALKTDARFLDVHVGDAETVGQGDAAIRPVPLKAGNCIILMMARLTDDVGAAATIASRRNKVNKDAAESQVRTYDSCRKLMKQFLAPSLDFPTGEGKYLTHVENGDHPQCAAATLLEHDVCHLFVGEKTYATKISTVRRCWSACADSKYLAQFKISAVELPSDSPERMLLDLAAGGQAPGPMAKSAMKSAMKTVVKPAPKAAPMRKPAAAARGRSGARGQRFPQKRRNKRSVQAASRRRDILAKARKARKAAQAKRKRLEAAGVFYTPKRQRVARARRGRSSLAKIYTYEDLRALNTKDAYNLMVQAGYLGDPAENVCPKCGWPLGSVIHRGEKRHPVQRCQRKACSPSSVQVKVTSGTWADVEVPPPKLAGVALLWRGALTSRMSTADMALIAKLGHKQRESIRQSLLEIISAASREEQKSIALSGQCETDATTLRVVQLKNGRNMHVRVFGMCKRGNHEQAVVHMLPAHYAARGGPTRPESTDETEPLISAHTGADVLIWHTDGARCYRRLMNHTKVKHAKRIWATVKTLTLSGGDVLCCYGGAQLQGGLWSHVKNVAPATMNTRSSESKDQLENWVHFWAWRYGRASCPDMFLELGSAVALARSQ
ncbi:unnamed protein product, partial [Prorocentrum cordatum]